MGKKAFFNRRGARASHRIEFLNEEAPHAPVSHPKRDHVNNVMRRREAKALKVILENLRSEADYTMRELIHIVRIQVSSLNLNRIEGLLKRLLIKDVLVQKEGILHLTSNYLHRQFRDAFIFLQRKLFGCVVMLTA